MTELLNYPEVQSVVLPFASALMVAMVLSRSGFKYTGLGMIAGFLVTVVLVNGIQLLPLTATRKIIFVGVFGAMLGALFDSRPRLVLPRAPLFAVLSVAAGLWITGVALLRKAGIDLLIAGLGISAYLAWITFSLEQLSAKPLRAESAAISLGLGTGLAAIIGSSALFGQLALAVSAATAGVLASNIFLKKGLCGTALTLPASGLLGLIGCATVMFADLAWATLAIMSLVPITLRWLPVPESWPRWGQALLLTTTATLVASLALVYAGYASDSSAYF